MLDSGLILGDVSRKRGEYGFGEHGFKHRTEWVFGAHWVPASELSEFLSAYYLCAKANSPSFSQNSPSLPRNSVRLSEFPSPKQYSRNSIPPPSFGYSYSGRWVHFLVTIRSREPQKPPPWKRVLNQCASRLRMGDPIITLGRILGWHIGREKFVWNS